MLFEIWNGESGNIIGDFDTERDALHMIREEVETHGRSVALLWGLLVSEDDGSQPRLIAEGPDLVDRALTAILA